MIPGQSPDVDGLRQRYPGHFSPFGRERLIQLLVAVAAVVVLLFGMAQLDFFSGKLAAGIGRLVEIADLMLPPDPGSWAHARTFAIALVQTIAIAFLGTLFAAVLALPVAMLAARNVTAARIVRFLSRRSLDTIRSVDILVWALIWVNVVGLGPFAGALAIMTADIGSFGKLFSEAMEAADRKPVEGILSTGGSHALGIRFGILPEVFPVLVSQVLYYFESNTRSASIIGIVGAGGIGLHLAEAIRTLELQQTSFIILLILVAVAVIDFISNRLRFAVIGPRGGTP
ncbi:MAG: phosphonate ABC transporter, permease protein PhnE [Alphaproteobacteria bacterium]|nr:phosphonate ABC transporter, permease protein PhnE [Alphaproteobacteria bacterium]